MRLTPWRELGLLASYLPAGRERILTGALPGHAAGKQPQTRPAGGRVRRRQLEVLTSGMPGEGEYEPSPQGWVREQVELYEGSGGMQGTTLRDEAASRIDDAGISLLRRERRANHQVDVARGYSQCGLRDEALAKLLEAEQLAPREVNCRPVARGTIENLVERSRGKPPSALRSLAERAGVTA
jgi:hypothetical protein